MRRLALVLVSLAAALAACGSEPSAPAPRPHDLAILRAGAARTLITGAPQVRSLPAGQPATGWRSLYATDTVGGVTTIRRYDLVTGRTLRSTRLQGHWTLPSTVIDGAPDAATSDGRTLVLASQTGGHSRFALLDASLQRPPRWVDLPGRFAYDAIAPDASALFLIESRAGGHYRVRHYDLERDELMPGAVVDKFEPDERMEGEPVARATPTGGDPWVYTLYRKDEGPFVHALNTQGFALCIDLPPEARSNDTAAREWGLVLAPDLGTLYAANPALGIAVAIDIRDDIGVRTLARFAPGAIHASARLALSPDARSLYVPTARGIAVLDARSLATRRTLMAGQRVTAALAAGGRVYGQEDDAVVKLDARTGAVVSRMRVPTAPASLAAVMRSA
jgi:hypothetical protein